MLKKPVSKWKTRSRRTCLCRWGTSSCTDLNCRCTKASTECRTARCRPESSPSRRRSQLWIYVGGHTDGVLHLSRRDFKCAKAVCPALQHPGKLHLLEIHRYRDGYPTH